MLLQRLSPETDRTYGPTRPETPTNDRYMTINDTTMTRKGTARCRRPWRGNGGRRGVKRNTARTPRRATRGDHHVTIRRGSTEPSQAKAAGNACTAASRGAN